VGKNFNTAIIFILGTIIYFVGMVLIGIMDIDASLYAEMSREMLGSGDLFDFRNRAIDRYLDKPPLLFWLSVFSYSLFGLSEFAYRLPTFLATLLGVYSTYRMARIYYKDREVPYLAGILLFSCQAWFLINHDVRTDTLLANFVIFASWQLAAYLERKRAVNFLLAFVGIGLAMMAKGPIGLMVPVIGFGSDLLIRKRWKDIFRPEWIAGILIILLTLSPMLVGLYRQYGTYGLEFFFWTQSFGRITGSNYWQDSSGPFFFIHTFLWSFLPWSLLTVAAMVILARKLIKSRLKSNSWREYVTVSAFLITFIILSRSSYKLPHYIYVVFPYASIFTAAGVSSLIKRAGRKPGIGQKITGAIQYFISAILLAASSLLIFWIFPVTKIWLFISIMVFVGLAFYFLVIRGHTFMKWFYVSLFSIFTANFILNIQVYPELMKYQAGEQIAEYIKEKQIPHGALYQVYYHSSAFDFYLGGTPPEANPRKIKRLTELKEEFWVITNDRGLKELEEISASPHPVKEFDNYRVQILTWKFLSPDTRRESLEKLYLLKL